MEQIFGLTDISTPYIRAFLPNQLKKYNIELSYSKDIQSEEAKNFLLYDGEKLSQNIYYTNSNNSLSYVLFETKNTQAKLKALDRGVLDCFEMPLCVEEMVKIIRNHYNMFIRKVNMLSDNIVTEKHRNNTFYSQDTGISLLSGNGNNYISFKNKIERLNSIESIIINRMITHRRIATNAELLNLGWQGTSERKSNILAATIKNIRKKLRMIDAPVKIKNVYGYGYYISEVKDIKKT